MCGRLTGVCVCVFVPPISAATVQAAEDTELPCKEMLQRENSTLEYKSMMDRYCLSPCDELSSLYHEFRDFVRFVETDAKERVGVAFLNNILLAHPSMILPSLVHAHNRFISPLLTATGVFEA